MGSAVGKTMEDNFKKQQEFMLEMNRHNNITVVIYDKRTQLMYCIARITLERQIQMQNQMRERMVAQQVAGAREMFLWLGSFYLLAGTGMIAAFARWVLL